MSEEVFKASNGLVVTEDEYGHLSAIRVGSEDRFRDRVSIPGVYVEALREYFQQERDQELRRWRDPENPSRVVYASDDTEDIYVIDEAKADLNTFYGGRERLNKMWWGADTAKRYFDAHPEPEPEGDDQ